MKLRQWQDACATEAMVKFSQKKHYFCLASPGAGKTLMASEVSRRLLTEDMADLVICFAPSVAIVSGIESTFSIHLNNKFDGKIGSIGAAYTYQAMRTLDESIWRLFETYRVFAVFDEIHHCSASDFSQPNSWGLKILQRVKELAAFTLAMTGTPWRSDELPLVLAEYTNPEGRLLCDYTYGLSEAVRDDVCRQPNIILLDNKQLKVSTEQIEKEYTSVGELLKHSNLKYDALLHDNSAIDYCLSLACQKLKDLRDINYWAGGLVVASSLLHANFIAERLSDQFLQAVCVVNYTQKDAQFRINQFKKDSTIQWIVAIGMVSEGTDIPRLQVCCHLSRIKTEMYFRQILGRVLRLRGNKDRQAWLYTFAEPNISEYAHRIDQDIPDEHCVEFITIPQNIEFDYTNNLLAAIPTTPSYSNPSEDPITNLDLGVFSGSNSGFCSEVATLSIMGSFHRKVLSFFEQDIHGSQPNRL